MSDPVLVLVRVDIRVLFCGLVALFIEFSSWPLVEHTPHGLTTRLNLSLAPSSARMDLVLIRPGTAYVLSVVTAPGRGSI